MRPAIGTVISVLVISGCGGSLKGGAGGTGGIIERRCSPGVAFSCECAPGIEGLQICAADGSGFLACMCGDPGTAGTSGTGDTGGVGGAGGTICDAPSLVFQSTDTQRGCGSEAGCHGAMLHESGLDLVSP